MSEISAQDAIGAYVVAAAHAYGVEVGQVMQPSFYSVEEFEDGAYRIPTLQNRDARGRFTPRYTECVYMPFIDLWAVLFSREGEPVFVAKNGETFEVVDMDQREQIIDRMMSHSARKCPTCGETHMWAWSHTKQEHLCYNCDPRVGEFGAVMAAISQGHFANDAPIEF